MIQIENKERCCGCAACSNICPLKCIEMVADCEGFLYPFVKENNCINCGLCERVCPIINNKTENSKEQFGYVAQNRNQQIRRESTSGGVFSAISMYVIKNQGVVYGAAWDDDFICKHIRVDQEDNLYRFRNSKYVQSDINDTFSLAQRDLKEGRLVCFSGTPCQIEGLIHFLQHNYDNLILVDVVCHSVPSPLVWSKYFDYLQKRVDGRICEIKFREKIHGYKYSALVARGEHKEVLYAEGIDTDQYLRAFFSDISVRPSCYKCKFKKRFRESDITIWDCYTVNMFNKRMDDDTGVTRVLVHSDKGKEVMDAIRQNLFITEVSPDYLVKDVQEIVKSVRQNKNRETFFADLNCLSVDECLNKWYPITIKNRIEKSVRLLCVRIGVYRLLNRLVKRIIKERNNR